MAEPSSDLLLLFANLTQHRNRDNILSLFTEGMTNLFPGHGFIWCEDVASEPGKSFEVLTRNKVYGHIILKGTQPLNDYTTGMLQNAVQMLAVILERLEQESTLQGHQTSLEMLVEKKTHDIILKEIRFRNLFEAMALGVAYQDTEGVILSVNPAAERILGLTLEQIQGHSSLDPRWHAVREDGSVFPVEEQPSMLALQTGKTVNSVIMGLRLRDAQDHKWININAVPLFRRGEKKPYQVFSTFEDITSQKRMRDEVKRSMSLYQDLVETSADLIWQCDAEGRYIFLNPAWEKVFGYRLEEMLGRRFTDFQQPEYAERDLIKFGELMKGDSVKGFETVHMGKDGKDIHLVFNAKFVRDDEGNITGTRGTAYDTTARKEREEKLISLSLRQEAILSAIPDILMEVDENKIYTWANRPGLDFFGGDVVGKSAEFYFEGEQDTYKSVQPLFNGSENVIYVESWQRRKDGDKRLLAWWCRVLKDHHGNVMGALSTARDITEERQVQEDIRNLNEQLEQRVIERTAELETTNRELEAFTYSVSHDLRAPLRAINGFTKILDERYNGVLDEDGRHYLDVICENTVKMEVLITDLLDLSRISRRGLRFEEIDMHDLVEKVISENIPAEVLSCTELKIEQLPWASGDNALIKQVWVNLIGNAVKFTSGKKKRKIVIGSQTAKNEIVYRIKDNGAGFNGRYAYKLFTVFQRLHSDEEFEGTGVGLAIVERIIKRHGGRVWAEGREGRGATFYFSLPGIAEHKS